MINSRCLKPEWELISLNYIEFPAKNDNEAEIIKRYHEIVWENFNPTVKLRNGKSESWKEKRNQVIAIRFLFFMYFFFARSRLPFCMSRWRQLWKRKRENQGNATSIQSSQICSEIQLSMWLLLSYSNWIKDFEYARICQPIHFTFL